MSQRLLTGLILLFSAAGATLLFGQQTDYEKAAIRKDKIKKVTHQVSYQDAQGKTFAQSTFTSEYDKNGNLIETIGSDPTGQIRIRWQYKYDSSNSMVETDLDGATQLTASYKYDGMGQVIGQTTFDSNGTVKKTHTIRRNSAGDMVEATSYDATGKVLKRATQEYDSAGNMIEHAEFGPTGNLVLKVVNSFNDQGNATEQLSYDSTGALSVRTVYSYDATEHLIEQTEYAPDGSIRTREKLQRDPRGFVTRSTKSDTATGHVTVKNFSYEFFP